MTRKNTYNDSLKAMYGLRRFGIKLGLDVIKKILSGLGNPENHFNCIHIAGSNGKGSIASLLSTILCESDYKVGLYTSPHLVRFNERICINNQPISDGDVIDAYEKVSANHHSGREPTFFEITTAMAFYEFKKHGVDWAVIETGMGGRLDATNIITPALSIISNISLEHKMYLGNTIAQIAAEKGGIIKEKIPLVTGARQKTALEVIKRIAENRNAPIYCMGEAFRVRRNPKGTFTYFGIDNKWTNLVNSLQGRHQVENAAIALASCEVIKKRGASIPYDNIKKGLAKNKWPARLEVVSKNPTVILDGAHNLSAARNLKRYLNKNLKDRKITLVIGILDDKPYKAMLQTLIPGCHRVILSRPEIDRALEPEKLHPIAKSLNSNVFIVPKVAEAIKYALENSSSNEVICIAGSLYVAGEAKAYFDDSDYFTP